VPAHAHPSPFLRALIAHGSRTDCAGYLRRPANHSARHGTPSSAR
jgi:hypothetical protein